MSRVLSLFAIAFIALTSLIAILVSAQNSITIQSCTDTLFCRAPSCTSQPVASGQCINASSSGKMMSEALICNPDEHAIGELWTFSDKFCTVPTSSRAFVCGECDDTTGKATKCWSRNGVESLAIQICDQTSTCGGTCKTEYDLPKGQCIPTQDKSGNTIYLKFDGAILGTTLDQIIWEGTATCSGKFVAINQLPLDHCMDGTSLSCKFQNNTADEGLLHRIKKFKADKKQ